jgi:hypothetical protein
VELKVDSDELEDCHRIEEDEPLVDCSGVSSGFFELPTPSIDVLEDD